jgi:hypothetical protein
MMPAKVLDQEDKLKYEVFTWIQLKRKKMMSCLFSNEVYSIQNYVIKIISDFRQVGGFLRVLWFPPLIKQDRQI